MHDSLGDAFVVEVGNLLAKNEVFEESRAAQPCLQRVLIIRDRNALIGGEDAIGRIDPDAIQRPDGRILAEVRSAAADLVGAVDLTDGAGADDRISGFD